MMHAEGHMTMVTMFHMVTVPCTRHILLMNTYVMPGVVYTLHRIPVPGAVTDSKIAYTVLAI